MGALGSATGSLLAGLFSSSDSAPSTPTQDHYYALEGDADDTGTATAIDGTATAGITYVDNGSGGQAARIPDGHEISLGSATAIKTDDTAAWSNTMRFAAASGSNNASLWCRRTGSGFIAGNKHVYLTTGGQLEVLEYGSTAVTVGSGLRDEAYHTATIYKSGSLMAILIDGALAWVGSVSWDADVGDLRIGYDSATDDTVDMDYISFDSP